MSAPSSKMGEGHALQREEERQIALGALPSVFCVLMDLRHLLHARDGGSKKGEKAYRSVTKDVDKAEKERNLKKSPTDFRADDGQRNTTGFVIASEGSKIKILTCAHGMGELYCAGSHKLTCDLVNLFFRIEVYCIHQESNVEAMVDTTPVSKRKRHCTPAIAVAIDTELDLLVLEVDVQRLWLSKQGSKLIPCRSNHPIMKMAKCNPLEADKVVLPGWPAMLSKSLATGQVSSWDRAYDSVTSVNIKGYKCKFLLVHGLTCDEGWSGGPVLDGNHQFVGLYHAASETTGYAVSRQDLETFLQRHGMVPKTLTDNVQS